MQMTSLPKQVWRLPKDRKPIEMIRFIFVFVLLFSLNPAAWCQPGGNNGSAVLSNPRPADFPTPPKNENLMFFIQRNKNKNTVVYDLHLESGGSINSRKPIDVYWLRYSSTKNGERMELTWLQRTFAFGYNAKKDKSKEGSFWITLTAYDGRKIHLEKDTKGKYVATMTIDGKYCRLNNIWVYADESGTWPKVIHVDLHGTDMITGKTVHERILNK
jgi:hypothetical protein